MDDVQLLEGRAAVAFHAKVGGRRPDGRQLLKLSRRRSSFAPSFGMGIWADGVFRAAVDQETDDATRRILRRAWKRRHRFRGEGRTLESRAVLIQSVYRRYLVLRSQYHRMAMKGPRPPQGTTPPLDGREGGGDLRRMAAVHVQRLYRGRHARRALGRFKDANFEYIDEELKEILAAANDGNDGNGSTDSNDSGVSTSGGGRKDFFLAPPAAVKRRQREV
mmetsp:Transcript_30060/g.59474  ORF Transcript_30060/g.59474 Transcript_30060/m.59474 type:complete len:220 (+) Transcript_30060:809-1468(+)